MSDSITQLSIRNLLGGHERYIIPMYQRNYAWEEGEITQLIQDVIDSMPKPPADGLSKEPSHPRPYYIGTLVVFPRQHGGAKVFETIDGQQRMTTLSLLASYLKNEQSADLSWYRELKLQFESRKNSGATFEVIFNHNFKDDPSERLGETEINAAIINGYQLIQKILPQKVKENNVTPQTFADYLFNHVQIMRVSVPHDTDLNHYFEVMNNRGEQLETHEVLKARMLKVLNGIEDEAERTGSQNCLHVIWEACANMERYVQMGFTPDQRDAVFGRKDWGQFQKSSFEELREAMGPGDSRRTTAESLNDIVAKASPIAQADQGDDAPERFNSVINFPNFLLHVLRVMTGQDIPLDDKRLIPTFDGFVFGKSDSLETVKQFAFSLLRCKYLFDQYVIKREFIKGTDGWSLKRLKWNDGGEKNRAGRGNYVNSFGDEDGSEGDIPPDRGNCGQKWPPARILMIIRNLARRHRPLSKTQLELRYGSMLSAARRLFGSWSKAVLAAGVDPAKLQRVVPWTSERVIEAILTRALRNEPLAARSIQPRSLVEAGQRFFGSWAAAMEAAGLDPKAFAFRPTATVSQAAAATPVNGAEFIHRPRQPWTLEMVIAAIQCRLRQQKPMNAEALAREDRALYRAATRRFNNWSDALRAAGVNPDDHRRGPGRKGGAQASSPCGEPARKSQTCDALRPDQPT